MSKALELRKAIMALRLELPPEIVDDVWAKAEAVLEEADDNALYRECLDAGGVDNWEWYGDSLTQYWEKHK